MTKYMNTGEAIRAFLNGESDICSSLFVVPKGSDLLLTFRQEQSPNLLSGDICVPVAKRITSNNERIVALLYKYHETLFNIKDVFFRHIPWSYQGTQIVFNVAPVYAFSEELDGDWKEKELFTMALLFIDVVESDLLECYDIFNDKVVSQNIKIMGLENRPAIYDKVAELLSDDKLVLELKPTIIERFYSFSNMFIYTSSNPDFEKIVEFLLAVYDLNRLCLTNPSDEDILNYFATVQSFPASTVSKMWKLYRISEFLKKTQRRISDSLRKFLMQNFEKNFKQYFVCKDSRFVEYLYERIIANLFLLTYDFDISNLIKSEYSDQIYKGIKICER